MQSLSDTQICSAALAMIGQQVISDIDDTTPNATKCRAVYYSLRDRLLRKYDWNFARARAQLQLSSTPPAFGWSYAYVLPTDCLVVRSCNANMVPWRVEGANLLTNYNFGSTAALPAGYPTQGQPYGPCNIIYTTQITESGLFDASFADLLSLFIASRIAYAITQEAAVAAEAKQEYTKAVPEAQSIAASEGFENNARQNERHSSWVQAHQGFGYAPGGYGWDGTILWSS